MSPSLGIQFNIVAAITQFCLFLRIKDIIVNNKTTRKGNKLFAALIQLKTQITISTVKLVRFVQSTNLPEIVQSNQAIVHQQL